MTVKDLIILGCGPTAVECQYHTETWGVNGTYTFAKRLDKLFFTDEESEVDACWYDEAKLLEVNPTCVFPVPYKRFASLGLNIEIFPMDKLLERFHTRFYSNTLAYMLAYALLHTQVEQKIGQQPRVVDGYGKIYLYGIDMMTHSTYIQEKGGVEYWMGVALGMGVEIVNTYGSATGKCWNGRMYGHYGAVELNESERLLAPWELIRVSKATNPQQEWILNDKTEEWEPVNTAVKVAGN